jgi:hypothetical protein
MLKSVLADEGLTAIALMRRARCRSRGSDAPAEERLTAGR